MLVAGRYRLTDKLGHGGMGEVWRGEDEVLHRSVAVKLLVTGSPDEQAAARFQLEAQTAARLSHPNVVTVFDFGTFEDRLFLVMEPLNGRTVADELTEHGPLEPERVATIGAQVAAALDAAHRQDVLHRDVKPANLLFVDDDRIKIGDFGIARFTGQAAAGLTSTGQVIGTSYYLAPERILGGTAGPASDVYALGCVLYELLSGHPPFAADTPIATLHQHLREAPESLRAVRPEVDEQLDELIMEMLAKEPDDRPSAARVAEALHAPRPTGTADLPTVPAGATTTAVSPALAGDATPAPAKTSWLRSRKAHATAAVALLGAAAAVALAFALPNDSPTDPPSGGGTRTSPAPTQHEEGSRFVADHEDGSHPARGHRSTSPSSHSSPTRHASSPSPTHTRSPRPTHSPSPTHAGSPSAEPSAPASTSPTPKASPSAVANRPSTAAS